MSRKYPKKVRKEFQRKLKAADAFVDSWTTSELPSNLGGDYGCYLTCTEAETFAELLRAFRYPNTAAEVLSNHAQNCETPHHHKGQGVWTFTISVGGDGVPDDTEYIVVADGKNGEEAEERATEYFRPRCRRQYGPFAYIDVSEVEDGIPSSTALYSWIDLRKAA